MIGTFHFEEAFSRSLGWLTELELQQLRGKRVAIAGAGGVGGSHLLTLVRLGVGVFHIADSDVFELGNFNRQAGAMMSTIGKNKADVMAGMARDINPELDIGIFGNIDESNIDAFLEGVDVFIDGIDAFAIDAKRLVFKHCAANGIPAITAGPFGTGSAYITFMPGKMTFDDYFAFNGLSPQEQQLNLFIGIAPKFLHWGYIADPSLINLKSKRGVTTPMACQISSAVAVTETMKILLGRGKVYSAPYYQQFDPYLNRFVRGKLRMGMRNPLMRLRKTATSRLLKKLADQPRPLMPKPKEKPIERIIDAALWTPSGDNRQPWRFDIKDDHRFTVHAGRYATSTPSLFEIRDGLPNVLTAGMMLENIRIAASWERMATAYQFQETDNILHIDVNLTPSDSVHKDPLFPYISIRSVNRKKYKTTPLTLSQKEELERSVGNALSVSWHLGFREKLKCAWLNARASDIRLREHKSYAEIQDILDWDNRFSSDRIPVGTLPLSPVTLRMMRWALKSWKRIDFLNTYLAGTLMPRLEMDIVPGLCAAAHFTLASKKPLNKNDTDALLTMGGAIQRFWLTITKLGLALQPSYAALVFGYLGSRRIAFSKEEILNKKAQKLAANFAQLYEKYINDIVFMGRVGIPAGILDSRSLRKPLNEMLI